MSIFGKRSLLAAGLLWLLVFLFAQAANLPVPQRYQEKDQWCWAASSQSILAYYGKVVTQTNIAQYGTGGTNTWNWLYGETLGRRGMDLILANFGPIGSVGSEMVFSQTASLNELNAGRPFGVRWGWDSGGGHVVVAHGMEGDTMYLMDPWNGPTINSYDWVRQGSGHTWTHSLRMTTNGPTPPSITTASPLPSGTQSSAYSVTLAASGGKTPYTWALASGALPAGITLNSGGTMAGTPSIWTNTSFAIRVTGNNQASSIKDFTLSVSPAPMQITSASEIPYALINAFYCEAMTAVGGTLPYTWTVVGGNLPDGLSLSSDGVLSGLVLAPTNVTFTLQAVGNNGFSATKQVALFVKDDACSFELLAGVKNVTGNADGAGMAARFGGGCSMAVDHNGTIYVADSYNHVVRKVTPEGVVSTLAGLAGVLGSADGTGTVARFNEPHGIAVDATGSVYVADTYNHTIRKVTAQGAVTTLAGFAGHPGHADALGSNAMFRTPYGVAVDASNTVFVTDRINSVIRQVTAAGAVTTLAGSPLFSGSADGTGYVARFGEPAGIVLGAGGDLYVSDIASHTIRKVTRAGQVTTLAGSAGLSGYVDGTGAVARLKQPAQLACDRMGNLLLADAGNVSVRMLTMDGQVKTLAGCAGYAGAADGTGSVARFSALMGLAINTNNGVLYAGASSCLLMGRHLAPGILTPAVLPFGLLSVSYDLAFDACEGVPPYAWSVVAGTLPPGLTLTGQGTLSGTPVSRSNFCFVIQAASANGARTTRAFSLVIRDVYPRLTTAETLPAGTVDSPYYFALTATDAVTPYTWSVLEGALPVGLSLGSTGVLTGIPDAATNAVLRLQVLGANGFSTSGVFQISVTNGPPVMLTSSNLSPGTQNRAYNATLSARSRLGPLTWTITSGSLQSGLALMGDGSITGTPAVSGNRTILVRVTDSAGMSATGTFCLAINPYPTIPIQTIPWGTISVEGTSVVARTGGTDPCAWTLLAGRLPTGVELDSAGRLVGVPTEATNLMVTVSLTDRWGASATNTLKLDITADALAFTNLAGLPGYSGTLDGTGGVARFQRTAGLVVGGDETVYIADGYGVRKVTPLGVVTTLAGSANYSGNADGTGTVARFWNANGLAVDRYDNLFVTDDSTIRKVTSAGVVTTVAGCAGDRGHADGTGTVARFYNPSGLAVDGLGNVYVADTDNHTIRKITSAGVVTTVAGSAEILGSADGTGTVARFNRPEGVAVDTDGTIYVADTGNDMIRQVSAAGVVATVAGDSYNSGCIDGTGTVARFDAPVGLAIHPAGDLYVTERYNHTIRRVSRGGLVTTLAGLGKVTGVNDGTGSGARFNRPYGVAVTSNGMVYVADNGRVTRGTSVAPQILTRIPLYDSWQNIAYGRTLVAIAGLPPYAWSVAAGGLPPGFSLSSSGELSGVAAMPTNALFSVRVTGGNGAYTTRDLSLAVHDIVPLISTSCQLARATANASYAVAFSAEDGMPPYLWSVISGSLPLGMTLSDGGVLSGTPATPATYGFTIRATGTNGVSAAKEISLVVNARPTVVTTDPLPWGTAGSDYYCALQLTNGTAPYTWTVVAGGLPQGVALSTSGEICGQPTAGTNAVVTIQLSDANGATTTKVFTVAISVEGCPFVNFAGYPRYFSSTDGSGTVARFETPCSIAVDSTGTVYVADDYSCTIRKITPAGVVTTFAGLAERSGSTDGMGTAARFNWPGGVAVGRTGTIYVADTGNQLIRRVTPAGLVSRLAGAAGVSGSADGTGTVARFSVPFGLAVDSAENVFVADTYNHTIRMISPAGMVTTVAGCAGVQGSADGMGTQARFYMPYGVAVSGAGDLYVADTYNSTIRKIAPDGRVTTVAGCALSAGSADGEGNSARFCRPQGIFVDAAGTVYVTDTENHTIRKVTPAGVVSTLAGCAGVEGSADGYGRVARFYRPRGVAINALGTVYVADASNSRISVSYASQLAPSILTSANLRYGAVGVAYTCVLSAIGGGQPFAWSVYSGRLPTGLMLSSTGTIGGVPGLATNAVLAVKVAGSNGLFAIKSLNLSIMERPLAAWRANNFTPEELANSGLCGDLADFDYDGIPNVLEYALAFDPRSTNTIPLPGGGLQNNYLTFTYRESKQATDLIFAVEGANSLLMPDWSTNGIFELQREEESNCWSVTVGDSITPTDAPARFMRLRVVLP